MAANCPRTLRVTLTAANTPYQLSALINGVDAYYGPAPNYIIQAQWVAVQVDPDAVVAGSAFKVGNSDLATVGGQTLYSTLSWPPYTIAIPGALINLHDVWIECAAAGAVVAVSFLVP